MDDFPQPQKGPQTTALTTNADISLYGGSAGSGKSFALLVDPLRYVHVSGFRGVFFRRTTPQITNPGGLWDESEKLYLHPKLGMEAIPRKYKLEWEFKPAGTVLQMRHLEHDNDVHNWQGAQLAFIAFDELCHFTKEQFFYMLSRARSMCGVRPYIRATANADAESWVAGFIEWWIDQNTGYPIPERAGVIRYFLRIDDEIVWADTKNELMTKCPGSKVADVKSFTFIPAKLTDNLALMKIDPGYEGNLKALPLVERERLLGGNWKIRKKAGTMFWDSCFPIVDAAPVEGNACRGWDFAATVTDDSDFTAGVLIVRAPDGFFYVVDMIHGRWATGDRNRQFGRALQDDTLRWKDYVARIEEEMGSAGKDAILALRKEFPQYPIRSRKSTGEKIVRASSWSAACQNGLVRLVRGDWNERFIKEHVSFPPPTKRGKDDIVDAAASAFDCLCETHGPPRLDRPLILLTPEEAGVLDKPDTEKKETDAEKYVRELNELIQVKSDEEEGHFIPNEVPFPEFLL